MQDSCSTQVRVEQQPNCCSTVPHNASGKRKRLAVQTLQVIEADRAPLYGQFRPSPVPVIPICAAAAGQKSNQSPYLRLHGCQADQLGTGTEVAGQTTSSPTPSPDIRKALQATTRVAVSNSTGDRDSLAAKKRGDCGAGDAAAVPESVSGVRPRRPPGTSTTGMVSSTSRPCSRCQRRHALPSPPAQGIRGAEAV